MILMVMNEHDDKVYHKLTTSDQVSTKTTDIDDDD